MLSEGKISKEEADSLFIALGLEEKESEKVKDSDIASNPKVSVTKKYHKNSEPKSILANIIESILGVGRVFNNGEKYKVCRRLSGDFTENIIPEIRIQGKNGKIEVYEQNESGYYLELELYVAAENQQEAESKVDAKKIINDKEESLDINLMDFEGASIKLYLANDLAYKLKSEKR